VVSHSDAGSRTPLVYEVASMKGERERRPGSVEGARLPRCNCFEWWKAAGVGLDGVFRRGLICEMLRKVEPLDPPDPLKIRGGPSVFPHFLAW
jgi:hypothetical protein